MRSNIAAAAFLILCIFVFGFMLNSCAGADYADRFSYTAHDFEAKIQGQIDGNEVSVILRSRRSENEGNTVTLTYKSPDALDGIVLSQTASGEYEARLGELVLQDFNAEGLLKPFLPFLYSGEIASARKDGEGHTVISVKSGENDLEYVFSEKSEYPHSVKGRVGERYIELFVETLEFI